MKKRKLGNSNLEVSAIGLGCLGFSHRYGPGVSDDEAIDLMRKAFDLGCTAPPRPLTEGNSRRPRLPTSAT
jgi:aryl-alcohol dehydrogenase-like predicted oxidoreductase